MNLGAGSCLPYLSSAPRVPNLAVEFWKGARSSKILTDLSLLPSPSFSPSSLFASLHALLKRSIVEVEYNFEISFLSPTPPSPPPSHREARFSSAPWLPDYHSSLLPPPFRFKSSRLFLKREQKVTLSYAPPDFFLLPQERCFIWGILSLLFVFFPQLCLLRLETLQTSLKSFLSS